ncbi:ATP-binding protein [Paenibacillus spongiae]|uniref:histidine kinase n=1 Tax=Paenibacillus spongiae TaxID=2909671 RepID=A0ABY5SDH7_9BACL|nr:ATP-binding protein [Paenibacillus spongiae]UVI30555.1 ATP-binding protein [Paenibacillus spongiae]
MNVFPPAPLIRLSLQALDDYINRLPRTMVVVLNEWGEINRCNPVFLRETGYAASALVMCYVGIIFESKSFQQLEHYGVFGKGHSAASTEPPPQVYLIKADGVKLSVTVQSLYAETEEGGRNLLFLYEQEPAHYPNLLERLGETMLTDADTGVILIRPDSRVMDISPLACQVLGVPKPFVMNEPLIRFFATARSEYELIRRTLENGAPVRNHPITWYQGEVRAELLMDVGLLRSPTGGMEGAYVIFKDVTNLRSLEEQVQRSDRLAMIGQIAAGAAHEIRNPLTAIRGFLQMFRKTMAIKGMDKEAGYTEIMLSELDRINNLVGEFLLLSKPKNVVFDYVEVDAVLNEIMPIVASEALLHNVVVNWEPENSLPQVMADREMLKQVFLNICKNGIEAMTTSGGTLTVIGHSELDGAERRLIIEIHDTGPGIPVHMLDKIFDPFVTTKASGTGLGLSVCQRILHEFGGTIRAVSKERGALFMIILPY